VENTILNDLKQHGIGYNHTFGGGGKLSITRMSSAHSRRFYPGPGTYESLTDFYSSNSNERLSRAGKLITIPKVVD
jgi:hypothetical protein